MEVYKIKTKAGIVVTDDSHDIAGHLEEMEVGESITVECCEMDESEYEDLGEFEGVDSENTKH